MKRGIFISIEGPDGSGKSTQIEYIKEFLQSRNMEVLFTREPGGTQIGERIREILLDKNCSEMGPMTEALLYAASRAQHVSQVIKPALAAGKVVVCDRFVDSSMAYQGFGRKLGEAVDIINVYAINGCMPDVTFLLKVDPDIGTGRIHTKRMEKEDRMDMEKAAFHQDVYRGYLELESRYPDRIVGIDASRSIEDIKSDILTKLEEVVKGVTG
ncbi:MAG: dTMP kinase [Firmicutes bacterium]|nr:dTMP kinase [Bacillota bacterium]